MNPGQWFYGFVASPIERILLMSTKTECKQTKMHPLDKCRAYQNQIRDQSDYYHTYENSTKFTFWINWKKNFFVRNILFFYNEKIQIFDVFIKFAKVEFNLDLDSVPIFSHFSWDLQSVNRIVFWVKNRKYFNFS